MAEVTGKSTSAATVTKASGQGAHAYDPSGPPPDWARRVTEFLVMNHLDVMPLTGEITAEMVKRKQLRIVGGRVSWPQDLTRPGRMYLLSHRGRAG